MRYDFYNECITSAKEVGTGLRLDTDPLNMREILTDFTTILEVLHSKTHDVWQRAIPFTGETEAEERYSLV